MEVVRFARRLSVPDLVLRAGGAAVRVRPWAGDTTTAQVLPVPGTMLPSAQEVKRWLHGLTRLGYRRARTAALGAHDLAPYREAGMDPWEELALLRRVLDGPVEAPPQRVRRAGHRAWGELSAIDAAAFPAGSQLDDDGILDACRATPRHRVRVAVDRTVRTASSSGLVEDRPGVESGPYVGYVVNGRAGTTGYVQRLAVHPCAAGRGWGGALVLDGLRWMRAYGCVDALVNTHVGNHRALALYERLGFSRLPEQLTVLGTSLATRP